MMQDENQDLASDVAEMESFVESGEGDVEAETVAFDAEVSETVMLLDDAPAMELPVWEPTGDADVDAALEHLRLLDDADLADHVAVFTDVHAALHQRLSDIASS